MSGAKAQSLIDSRAPVLRELEARSEAAISDVMRTSLEGTLKDLRRAYTRFTASDEPTTAGPDGGPSRRPGEYAVRESATRMLSLMDAAQGFLTPKELKEWSTRYKGDLAEAQQMGGELGGRLMELSKPGKIVSGTNKPAIEAAARTASAYIEAESAKFRDQIVQITGEGVARGWGAKKIEGAVRRALAGEDSTGQGLTQRMGLERRAQIIARSEIANAYVGGQLDNARRNGYAFVRWIAAEDERTCPTCVSRHGLVFKLSDVVMGAHPLCRCSASPVETTDLGIKDLKERAAALDEDFWAQSREDVAKEFAASKGKTVDEVRGLLDRALRQPSASELRRRPDLSDSLPPVAVPGAQPVLKGLSKTAVTKAVKALRGDEGKTVIDAKEGKGKVEARKVRGTGPVVRTAAQETDRAARRAATRQAIDDAEIFETKASKSNYDRISRAMVSVKQDLRRYENTIRQAQAESPPDQYRIDRTERLKKVVRDQLVGLRGARMMQGFTERQHANELFSDPNLVKTRYAKIPNSGKGLSKADAFDGMPLTAVYDAIGHDVTQPQIVRSLKDLREAPGLVKDANGNNLILYRGLTEASQIEQFIGAGPDRTHFPGRGIYGDGTYAAAGDMTKADGFTEDVATRTADSYSDKYQEFQSHRYVAAMGVREDAKIFYGRTNSEEQPGVEPLFETEMAIVNEAYDKLGVRFSNHGAAAAAMGYDGYGIHVDPDTMYFVMFNRGALVAAASSKF